jgi:hypothetical protein
MISFYEIEPAGKYTFLENYETPLSSKVLSLSNDLVRLITAGKIDLEVVFDDGQVKTNRLISNQKIELGVKSDSQMSFSVQLQPSSKVRVKKIVVFL